EVPGAVFDLGVEQLLDRARLDRLAGRSQGEDGVGADVDAGAVHAGLGVVTAGDGVDEVDAVEVARVEGVAPRSVQRQDQPGGRAGVGGRRLGQPGQVAHRVIAGRA